MDKKITTVMVEVLGALYSLGRNKRWTLKQITDRRCTRKGWDGFGRSEKHYNTTTQVKLVDLCRLGHATEEVGDEGVTYQITKEGQKAWQNIPARRK